MTFLTAQQYEDFSYRFFLEDDGSYVVKIFLEDSIRKVRRHKTKDEVLEKYGEYFAEIEKSL
jgi:hypothetical protein